MTAPRQVHREIQQRSPISGSRRPSLSSMISTTLGLNTTQLQRRLSDLAAGQHSASLRYAATPEPSRDRGRQSKPCVRRHASDLAWRPLIQSGNISDIINGISLEETLRKG